MVSDFSRRSLGCRLPRWNTQRDETSEEWHSARVTNVTDPGGILLCGTGETFQDQARSQNEHPADDETTQHQPRCSCTWTVGRHYVSSKSLDTNLIMYSSSSWYGIVHADCDVGYPELTPGHGNGNDDQIPIIPDEEYYFQDLGRI